MAGNGEDIDKTLHSMILDPDSDIVMDIFIIIHPFHQLMEMLNVHFLHNSQMYLEIFVMHYLKIFLMQS